jgi:diguanylate cyclase (GGDEF)-like protein
MQNSETFWMSLGWFVAIGLLSVSGLRGMLRRSRGESQPPRPAPDATSRPWRDEIPAELAEIESALAAQARRMESPRSKTSAADLAEWKHELQALQHKMAEVRAALQEHLANLDQLFKEARTDALTGLLNRRAFDEHLAQQFAIFERYGTPFALVLFDVDHFKEVNDGLGHPAGDEVLRQFARIMTEGVRSADLVARYGGEEFAVLLPQTGTRGAAAIAERIRRRVAAFRFHGAGREIGLQISAGVTTACDRDEASELVERADRALYQAKAAGRNRIFLHTSAGVEELASEHEVEGAAERAPDPLAGGAGGDGDASAAAHARP